VAASTETLGATAGGGTTAATASPGHARPGLALLALALALPAARAAAPADQVEVVLSRDGFRPKSLNARKGETVRLLLRSGDEEHCFALDAFRVEKRVLPGRTTSLDLTPDRVGSFAFYCCLEPANEAQRGRLVVAE
jgi:hypothetical protein